MNEKFSENLKRVRQDARMTQAEVAKIVGVAKNTYCNWELGTREPNILKIKALAKLFGVSVDYLVGLEPTRNDDTDAEND
jgi:transcriptional regulator with XRE-family HTH domain